MRDLSKNTVRANAAIALCAATFFGSYPAAAAEMHAAEALAYFSDNYREARAKFLSAAKASGGRIESFENPLSGPQGETLSLDVAAFGTKHPPIIIVLSSGTHGVEGFAGSAIQIGLLREGIATGLSPDIGILMIHAINPYGFAYLRRVNEDNVDLNRNFVDHSSLHPENLGYSALAEAIAPQTLSFWDNTASRVSLLWYRVRHGSQALREAITGGQYSHPKGLFYGGRGETWSNKTIRRIAKRYLAAAERVVVIDVHTGLGAYANIEIILNSPEDSAEYRHASEWWGDDVKTTVSGESVSVHLQSTLKLALPRMLPGVEVTAVSQEFGTLPPKDVFWALRSENWLHHHADNTHPDSGRIKKKLLQAFYPEDAQWRLRVWQQGRDTVKNTLANLAIARYQYGTSRPVRPSKSSTRSARS